MNKLWRTKQCVSEKKKKCDTSLIKQQNIFTKNEGNNTVYFCVIIIVASQVSFFLIVNIMYWSEARLLNKYKTRYYFFVLNCYNTCIVCYCMLFALRDDGSCVRRGVLISIALSRFPHDIHFHPFMGNRYALDTLNVPRCQRNILVVRFALYFTW